MDEAYIGAIGSLRLRFGVPKNRGVALRLTDAQRRRLEEQARREGVSLSEIARRALTEHIQRALAEQSRVP